MAENKKIKIYTPNPEFSGVREGVTFKNGVGEADAATARILIRNYGYSKDKPKNQEKEE